MSSTLSQTTGNSPKQKHSSQIFAAKTFGPRNQATEGKTQNSLFKDLQSISSNIKNVAQDTYQLNNGIAARIGADHYNTSVKEIQAINRNLKPTDSRTDAINTVAKLYSDKVLKVDKFGGNEDMQREYAKTFIQPIQKTAARQMSIWQDEQHAIDGKIILADAQDKMSTMIDDPNVEAENLYDILSTVKNSLRPYMVKADTYVDTYMANKMTKSLVADLESNTLEFFRNGGSENIYNINSENFNQEKTSELFNKKYSMYATMDKKGNVSYKTKDANVMHEIQSGWAGFQHSVRATAKGVKKKHDSEIISVWKSFRTVGREQPLLLTSENIPVTTTGLYTKEDATKYLKAYATDNGIEISTEALAKISNYELELEKSSIPPEQISQENNTQIGEQLSINVSTNGIKSHASVVTKAIEEFKNIGEYKDGEPSEISDKRASLLDSINRDFRIAQNVESSVLVVSNLTKSQRTAAGTSGAYQEYLQNKTIMSMDSTRNLKAKIYKVTHTDDIFMQLMDSVYERHNQEEPFNMSKEEVDSIRNVARGMAIGGKKYNSNIKDIEEKMSEYAWLPTKDYNVMKNGMTIFVNQDNEIDKYETTKANGYIDMSDSGLFSSGRKVMIERSEVSSLLTDAISDEQRNTNFVPRVDKIINKKSSIREDVKANSKAYGFTLVASTTNNYEFNLWVLDKDGKATNSGESINLKELTGK